MNDFDDKMEENDEELSEETELSETEETEQTVEEDKEADIEENTEADTVGDGEDVLQEETETKVKKHRFSKKLRVLIGVDITLVSLWLIVFLTILIGKKVITNRFIDKLNYETFDGYHIDENAIKESADETVPDEDNLDEVERNLIDADSKTFFYSTEAVESNYVTNILFIGTDVRVSDSWNGNSDSMILVSINKKTKKIVMTSFMRDMYVYIPELDTSGKLNLSHAVGGSNLLCATITGNFKIKVDKYLRVDFYGMMNIVDAAGGIDMYVTDEEIPVANDYIRRMCQYTGQDPNTQYLTTGGDLHLNGMQAVAYARIRYVGNADYERTNRQRKILNAIFNNCKSMSMTQIMNFADNALPNISTNMESDEIWDIIEDAITYLGYEVVSQRVPFDDSSTPTYIDNISVLLPDYKKNVELLINGIYGE